MGAITLHAVEKYHGDTQTIAPLDLIVTSQEVVAFLGPNGSGKSTLLNMVAGIDMPSAGRIVFDTQNPHISYLFQNYRATLMPWYTVLHNIAWPCIAQGAHPAEAYLRATNLHFRLELSIGLSAYPYTLSGGEQQMTALVRALITEPDILLLDEPLSALDVEMTLKALHILLDVLRDRKTTTLLVSHDINQAVLLSDRIVLLTRQPATVACTIINPLPHPRTINLLGTKAFTDITTYVLNEFRRIITT